MILPNGQANVSIYQAITLKDVYPNVDVRYYTYNGMLKYDIIAKPGADISKIALKYEGADKLQVKNKELVVSYIRRRTKRILSLYLSIKRKRKSRSKL